MFEQRYMTLTELRIKNMFDIVAKQLVVQVVQYIRALDGRRGPSIPDNDFVMSGRLMG